MRESSSKNYTRFIARFYQNAPFVVVLEPGQFPATKHVYGTNYCHIGLALDKRTNRVIVVSAIDNLVKGAAGQAIQNMNLMCGFEETVRADHERGVAVGDSRMLDAPGMNSGALAMPTRLRGQKINSDVSLSSMSAQAGIRCYRVRGLLRRFHSGEC